MRTFHVYILASKKHGTLYVGVTARLAERLAQHRRGDGSSFVSRYHVNRLVHVESYDDPRRAIQREKSLKRWPRQWKTSLIEAANPDWRDLAPAIHE